MTTYLTTAYLGPIEYYSKLFHSPKVVIEAFDNFVKQTYRNRCFIGAANDRLSLSIPVESNNGQKCPTRDIRMSEHGNWRHQHWYALYSTYNNTPFFEFYEDDLAPFFEKKHKFLFDFNEELRELICSLLEINPNVVYSEEYHSADELIEMAKESGELILDYREAIHPKKDYKEMNTGFIDVPYYQLFEQKWGFRPNLSIVDLLFNMGPESILVLKDSEIANR